MYTKESLEELRSKVRLSEVVAPHLRLIKSGGYRKALCPFHSEKTPSFVIQSDDTHYHCFGCGVHGDAIAFLMNYLQLTFVEAVESLAEKFGVQLYSVQGEEVTKQSVPHLSEIKRALFEATAFFHFFLLYTEEGRPALQYLYGRGMDNAFIKRFQIGLAPREDEIFLRAMEEVRISGEVLKLSGLVKERSQPFFRDRIIFPVEHPMGYVIGFSARSYRQDSVGPKYVNSPETPLFKKSKILFGYSYSRKRIVKEQKAILVEGQIDALRLIEEGWDYAIASQGTAFGEEGVQELLRVGVKEVYLAFDADPAGQQAVVKVGQLFQKKGVTVWIVHLPEGMDPDMTLHKQGKEKFAAYLEKGQEYLDFLLMYYQKDSHAETPAGKNALVRKIGEYISQWEHPLMIHEALKKLSRLLQIPETLIEDAGMKIPLLPEKQQSPQQDVFNPDFVLEGDLLRLMVLGQPVCPRLIPFVMGHISPDELVVSECRALFVTVLKLYEQSGSIDVLALVADTNDVEIVPRLLKKKIDTSKIAVSAVQTVKTILERNWLQRREDIRRDLHSSTKSEEELFALAREFDAIKTPIIRPFEEE